MEPYPARADAERLAAVSAEQAARFGDVLRSAGFAAAAGNPPMEVEGRARGGRNVPRVMRITAAGRPLDIFVRLFLMGIPTGVREARAAMAPVRLEEWVEAGDVVRYMLLPLYSREESEKFLRDAMDEHASPAWRSVVRAVVDTDSGRLIGLGGVAILLGAEEGELWYLLDPACWGRGLGGCCAGELAALGFGELQLHRIWATCLPENPASGRVLEKVGMRKEGFLNGHLKTHGEWKDCFLYALLREECESKERNFPLP